MIRRAQRYITSHFFLVLIVWVLSWYIYYIRQNISLWHLFSRFLDNLSGPFYPGNFSRFPWGALFFIAAVNFLITLLGSLFVAKCVPYFRTRYIVFQGFCIGLAVMAFLWEKAAVFFLLNPYIITASFLLFLLLIFIMPSFAEEGPVAEIKEYRWQAWDYLLCLPLLLINAFIFYWALFYPVSYWDGLILYVRYARETFLMEGFPVRITLQVGDGLGANYPHLFEVFSAGIAVLYGTWDDLMSRVFPPVLGVFTQIYIYMTARLLFRSARLGLIAALLYRMIPYAVAYNIYASNYATALVMTAIFFYYITAYYKSGHRGYFLLAGITAGLAAHINYLMLILSGFFVISSAIYLYIHPGVRYKKWFWSIIVICVLISSTWYIRNYIVTGNPVYAFYHEILGGKNINPAIEEFCFNEWQRNGDGIGNGMYGETLLEKIGNSFLFWISNPTTGWKVNPFLTAFFLPGLAILFIRRKFKNPLHILFLLFIGALLFYHYCISGLYLYHIIIILPVAVLIAAYSFTVGGKSTAAILMCFLFAMSLFPGWAFSIYGFKLTGSAQYRGQELTAMELLRMPVPERHDFWEWVYGPEGEMWRYINDNIHHRTILTHDNRYLCYNEHIQIIHLDDWYVQKVYDMETIQQKAEYFRTLGIHYYLFIENELNMINNEGELLRDWVGLDEFIEEGFLQEKYRPSKNGGPVLYRFLYNTRR